MLNVIASITVDAFTFHETVTRVIEGSILPAAIGVGVLIGVVGAVGLAIASWWASHEIAKNKKPKAEL